MESKQDVQFHAEEDGHGLGTSHVAQKWQGTEADQRDMSILGRVQELRRNFRFISILGFGSTLICTWEVILTTLITALTNGGTAGLVWGYVAVVVGFSLVYASVAEMASMAPTSGGQYHWVSEFSPRSCQKFLSYITGWLCFTGWQAAIVAIAFLAGTMIQGLAILNHPDSYVPERWHGTMLVIAISTISIVFNTVLAKRLPLVEGLFLILHVIGVFAIIIPLWALSPLGNAKDVFTKFENNGGWTSTGLSVMVGLQGVTVSMLGFDCIVHMSEEVKDASKTIPRAILSSVTLNAFLGFITLITLCFCLGDVTSVIESATGFPFIQIFYNSTNSLAGTSVMVAIPILALTGSCIAEVATASRQLWSFARDNGVPFSRYIAKVTPGSNIPLNAVVISLIATILLSLINIGSTAALSALLSLSTGGILTSYMVCIGCVALKRIRGEMLPPSRFSLGRFGLAINIGSICFLLPIWLFAFFPAVTPVEPVTMNWGSLIFGAVIMFATVYYIIHGHKVYVPPVALVKRDIYD